VLVEGQAHGRVVLVPTTPKPLLCRVMPVMAEDLDSISALLFRATRLTHGFSDVPSIRPIQRLAFARPGTLLPAGVCPPHSQEAILEMPLPTGGGGGGGGGGAGDPPTSLHDFISAGRGRPAAGGGGGVGAGGDAAAHHLPCGYPPWEVQAVFVQLSQVGRVW